LRAGEATTMAAGQLLMAFSAGRDYCQKREQNQGHCRFARGDCGWRLAPLFRAVPSPLPLRARGERQLN